MKKFLISMTLYKVNRQHIEFKFNFFCCATFHYKMIKSPECNSNEKYKNFEIHYHLIGFSYKQFYQTVKYTQTLCHDHFSLYFCITNDTEPKSTNFHVNNIIKPWGTTSSFFLILAKGSVIAYHFCFVVGKTTILQLSYYICLVCYDLLKVSLEIGII